MIDVNEITTGVFRIALWDEADLVKAGIFWPGASYNLFLIKADRPAIIQTLYRRTFHRIVEQMKPVVEPAKLQFIVVPHHEGDSSGAVNEWLRAAPHAEVLCSELCAALSLIDFCDKPVRVVKEGEVVDLGSHRLRFLMTPQVNQWDSLMVYEQTTGTLFPNDLFSGLGTEVIADQDRTDAALGAARHLGYQPDDPVCLGQALDKIAKLEVRTLAPMHGPAITAHVGRLIEAFRRRDAIHAV